MTEGIPRGCLDAVFRLEAREQRLASAIWLYLALLRIASRRGLVCRQLEKLADDLGSSADQIQEWLGTLHGAGLIEPTTPPPFLVIRLNFWPGETAQTHDSAPAPYSYSSQASRENKSSSNSYSPEGSDVLLKKILSVLGESDPESFRPVLQLYPDDVIRKALDRVQAAGEIRKSKTALFRYLLGKLSSSKHDPR